MSYLTNVPLWLGIIMLAGVGFMIWRKPSDAQPVTIIFLAGVGLILLSDDHIQNFKFGTSGVEVTRRELEKSQVGSAEQIGKLARDLEEQKKALEAQKSTLDAMAKQSGVRPPEPAADPARGAADQAFAENSKYSILVYFRDSADRKSTDVVAKLVKAGFKSAKVNTDLTETGRLLPSGTTRVRYNEGLDQVAKRVFDIVQDGNASLDPRAAARQIPGDVQILLY